jgi:hypothetical protein
MEPLSDSGLVMQSLMRAHEKLDLILAILREDDGEEEEDEADP